MCSSAVCTGIHAEAVAAEVAAELVPLALCVLRAYQDPVGAELAVERALARLGVACGDGEAPFLLPIST